MTTSPGGERGYDFERIRQENPLLSTADRYGLLVTPAGPGEGKACCVVHDEKTPSMHLYQDGHWKCFGCEERGDVIDLVAAIRGVTLAEAAQELGAEKLKKLPRVDSSPKPAAKDPYDAFEPLGVPGNIQQPQAGQPFQAWNVKRSRVSNVTPTVVYRYDDLGYVLRVDQEDGGKFFMVVRWCVFHGKHSLKQGWEHWFESSEGWCTHRFDVPLPLYGEVAPTTILVEGEKACDVLSEQLRDEERIAVATWPGGGKNAIRADLERLAGRHILLWPDADEPGVKAMLIAAERLEGCAASVRWLDPPDNVEKGWDAADAVDDGVWSIEWAKGRAVDPPSPSPLTTMKRETSVSPAGDNESIAQRRAEAGIEGDPDSAAKLEKAGKEPLSKEEVDARFRENPYFKVLGHQGSDRAYHDLTTGQLHRVAAASGHTWHQILALAPERWWWKTFPECTTSRALQGKALDALFRVSAERGPVEPEVRGRGAWYEDDRLVWHLGDRVWMDGKGHDPARVNSVGGPRAPIYTKQVGLGLRVDGDQATDEQCREYLDLCKWLRWQHPPDGVLLAGWTVAAVVGGALPWRPHIWITGETGSGKSTIIQQLLQPTLGDLVSVAVGGSSAPGIRNITVRDSLPVIVDEHEGESRDQREMQDALLALVRAASAGGKVFKADQKGGTKEYHLHSCYCFSSVNPRLQNAADANRISNLILLKDKDEDADPRYQGWLKRVYALVHDQEFGRRLFARICAHFGAFYQNIETFRAALRRHLPDARHADQAAPMIAGAYLLVRTNTVTIDQAYSWVSSMSWGDNLQPSSDADEGDGARCLQNIMLATPAFEWRDRTIRPSIYQLLCWAIENPDTGMNAKEASSFLATYGIRVIPGTGWGERPSEFVVANRHEWIARVLARTPWGGSWRQALLQLPGATLTPKALRFGPRVSRGVTLPISSIEDQAEVGVIPSEGHPGDTEEEYQPDLPPPEFG